MTAKKLKTSLTATQGQRSVGASTTTGRISSTVAQKSQVPRISGVKARERQVLRTEVPEGVDLEVLAARIAAHMQTASMPNTPIVGQVNELQASYSMGPEKALKGTASPIDAGLSELHKAVETLESQSQLLIQALDPVLLYDYGDTDVKAKDGGMPTTAISPMHSRINDLTDYVNAITARLRNVNGRVQL